MKVLFIQRRLTNYRVPFFLRLQQVLAGQGIEFNVAYGLPTNQEELRQDGGDWSGGILLENRYMSVGARQLVWQGGAAKAARDHDLVIMPHENTMLSNLWIALNKRRLKTRISYFAHGGNLQSRRSDGWEERLRRWCAHRADWMFAYTPLSVERISSWGIPVKNISCVYNAIDQSTLQAHADSISETELIEWTREKGLDNKAVGIFLGGLHEDKRLDFLFKAADLIRTGNHDFELVIIGDGPLRSSVKTFARVRPWVHWVEAQFGRDKVRYALLGQLILNPGMVGLVILDSFALGLPLVTTDCGIHSPEIAYLEPGHNGVMTKENVTTYAEEVISLLRDEERRQRLVAACLEDSKKYTIEKMAQNFCDGIRAVLAEPLYPK